MSDVIPAPEMVEMYPADFGLLFHVITITTGTHDSDWYTFNQAYTPLVRAGWCRIIAYVTGPTDTITFTLRAAHTTGGVGAFNVHVFEAITASVAYVDLNIPEGCSAFTDSGWPAIVSLHYVASLKDSINIQWYMSSVTH